MTKGTRSFLNFLFFVCAVGGGLSIFYSDLLISEYALLIPTAAVVLFAFSVAAAQKAGTDAESAEHYAESIYFLGFFFTLVSLATLFYRMGAGGLGSSAAGIIGGTAGEGEAVSAGLTASRQLQLSTEILENTFSYIGIAVTTSVAGVLLRNIVRSKFLKNNPGGQGDFESAVMQLKLIAEGMNGGFTDTMSAIGAYFEQRKDLAGVIRKKEEAYVDGLENFTDAVNRFSRKLGEVEKDLLGSAETLGRHLEKQAEGIGAVDESLKSFADRIHSLKNDSDAIDLQGTADQLASFSRETGELNAVLDSLIDIIERKVDSLRRAG